MSLPNNDSGSIRENLKAGAGYVRDRYGFSSNQIAFRWEFPQCEPMSAEKRAELDERERVAREAVPGWWRKLQAAANNVARAVLEVHHRNEYGDCAGCMDEMGQVWPCPTVEAVSEALSNPVPDDLWMLRRDELAAMSEASADGGRWYWFKIMDGLLREPKGQLMTRLEVNINNETARALRAMAELNDTNVTDIIWRSVMTYKIIDGYVRRGWRLRAVSEDEVADLLFPDEWSR